MAAARASFKALATVRTSDLNANPGRERPRLGTANAITSPRTARTTSSSIKVKPRPSARSPVGDVLVLALAAFLAVGAQSVEIIFSVFPRRFVDVRLAPRIGQRFTTLEIGAIPSISLRGLVDQGNQPL